MIEGGAGILAERVDAAARAVPGVAELYFARSLPRRLWPGGGDGTAYSVVTRRRRGRDPRARGGGDAGRARDRAGEPDHVVVIPLTRTVAVATGPAAGAAGPAVLSSAARA